MIFLVLFVVLVVGLIAKDWHTICEERKSKRTKTNKTPTSTTPASYIGTGGYSNSGASGYSDVYSAYYSGICSGICSEIEDNLQKILSKL